MGTKLTNNDNNNKIGVSIVLAATLLTNNRDVLVKITLKIIGLKFTRRESMYINTYISH